MMALALYAASAALFAASPSDPRAEPYDDAQAVAAPAEGDALSQQMHVAAGDADARRLHARRAPLRGDPGGRAAAGGAPAPTPGFAEPDDASRFQQQTWTGP